MMTPLVQRLFIAVFSGLVASSALAEGGNDEVVARVNGSEIRYSDLALAEEEMGRALANLQEDSRFDYLLSMLIDRRILSTAAKEKKIDEDPAYQRRVDYYKDKALRDVYWNKMLDADVTEEDARAFYEQETAKITPEDEVRARHILVPSKEEAEAVAARLKSGEAFDAVAREVSKDPGAAEGGDLGYFTKDDMVPEFSEAAFALQPGEISDPVETKFGWHIIKVEDRRPRQLASFDEVKDRVMAVLAQQRGREMMTRLRAAAKVEVIGPDGQAQHLDLTPKADAEKTPAE